MGQLRDQMQAELRLRNVSPRTITSYLRVVRALAAWHRRSPAELNTDEARAFLLDLVRDPVAARPRGSPGGRGR